MLPYLLICRSAVIRLAVSVATPTMMSTEVPANPRRAGTPVRASVTVGAHARSPRNKLPKTAMFVRRSVTYSAVLRPGRHPGMDVCCTNDHSENITSDLRLVITINLLGDANCRAGNARLTKSATFAGF
jgi:hypothetical protein